MSYTPITPVDVTPSTSDAWTDVDVSTYISASATGVVYHIVRDNAGATLESARFRKNGSTDDVNNYARKNTHNWGVIGVDGSGIFETYLGDHTTTSIYLVGYFEDDAHFFTNANDLSRYTSYTDQDITSYLDGSDTAVAAIVEAISTTNYQYYARKNGSTDDFVAYLDYGQTFIVGVDSNDIYESKWSSTGGSTTERLIGYIKEGYQANTNKIDVSIGSTGSFVDIVANGNALAAVIEIDNTNTAPAGYALRKNGSTEDIYNDINGFSSNILNIGIIEADAGGVIEGKIEDTDVDFFVNGYFIQDLSVNWSSEEITIDATKVPNQVMSSMPVRVTEDAFSSAVFTGSNTDGSDIRFTTDSAGLNQVPFEIEKWDKSGGTCIIYVKIDVDYVSNTTFYIWYGNASANALDETDAFGAQNVWRSEYPGIYHFNEASGDLLDSTSNQIDLIDNNTVGTNSGTYGDGRDFEDTNNEYFDLAAANTTPFRFTGDMSIMMVFKAESINRLCDIVSILNTGTLNNGGYTIQQRADNKIRFAVNDGSSTPYVETTDTISADTWYMLYARYDASATTAYIMLNNVNEVTNSSFTSSIKANSTDEFCVGTRTNAQGSTFDFDGVIKELRLGNGLISPDWATAVYNNWFSPGSFFVASGSSETAAVTPVDIQVTPTATTATYSQVNSASASPVALSLSTVDPTATYDQVETAAATPVPLQISPTTLTASYEMVETATVSPVIASINLPAITATFASGTQASVLPLSMQAILPSISASYVQVETSSVSPIGVNATTPTITVSYTQVETQAATPVEMLLTPTSVTATYQSNQNAGLSPLAMNILASTVTATYAQVNEAGVSPITLQISVPSVTGSQATEFQAVLDPISLELSVIEPIPTYISVIQATLIPLGINVIIPSVQARSGGWSLKPKTDQEDWLNKPKDLETNYLALQNNDLLEFQNGDLAFTHKSLKTWSKKQITVSNSWTLKQKTG